MIYKIVRATATPEHYRSMHEVTLPCDTCHHRARPLSYDMDKLTITVHSCGIGIFHFHYLVEAQSRLEKESNKLRAKGKPDNLVILEGDSDCQECYNHRGAQWFVPREVLEGSCDG